MNLINKNQGITLIVLVITIIVLLVLAGVAIASLTGRNNMINRAQQAKTEYEAAQDSEKLEIGNYETYLGEKSGNSSESNVWKRRGFSSSNIAYDRKYEGSFLTESDWIKIQSDGSLLSSWAGLEEAETLQGYINSGKWELGTDTLWNGEGGLFKMVSGGIEIYTGESKEAAFAKLATGVPDGTLTLAAEEE